MNTEAIERIKGYCCEVTQEQWDELVRVADEVGVKVRSASRKGMVKPDKFARLAHGESLLGVYIDRHAEHTVIPFSDFLAKLKGEEKWQPKAGEMVDAHYGMGCNWEESVFIGKDGDYFVCRKASYGPSGYRAHSVNAIRPIRPTITRTEAERLINKRIID
jgi:hypothetical protein